MSIVSLGSNCAVAYQLKQYHLRTHAYPFDWVKVSLNSLVKVLANNFERYEKMSIKKLSENHISWEENKPSYIISNDYGITMAHELVNEQNLEIFSNILLKRIDRFRLLENSTFVRLETANLTPVQMLVYNNLVEQLDKYFTEYQLVVISKIKPSNSKIKWIELKSFDENWSYPSLDWKSIFNL
jgi:hypothetical protein